jgi:hypothetical protein
MAIANAQLPAVLELPEGLAVVAGGRSLVERPGKGEPEFESLAFPRRVWVETDYDLRYHVYTSPIERVSIPAASAIEAITKSGVKRPFKVLRGHSRDDLDKAVISGGRLVAVADEERASETRDEPAASLTGEEVEAPLSRDDER